MWKKFRIGSNVKELTIYLGRLTNGTNERIASIETVRY